MEELLKQIIENIFPSVDMKKYLCEHVSELCKWQIMSMISGALVSLDKKREYFMKLAEIEAVDESVVFDTEEESKSYLDAPYSVYVKKIDKALADLHIKSKDEGVLLMQERILYDNEHKIIGDLPFFSYEKFETYLKDCLENNEDFCDETGHAWHIIERYEEDKNGDLIEGCNYVFVNGEVMFYTYCDDYDCWLNPDLNLPVPFKVGDIIEVNARPFAEKKRGVILEVGDNWDCCCVQVAHLARLKDGIGIDHSALKHSSYFYDNDGYIDLSALYSAAVFKGTLTEDEEFLRIVSEYVDGDEDKGRALWRVLDVPVEKFTKEYIENNVKPLKTKIDGGN